MALHDPFKDALLNPNIDSWEFPQAISNRFITNTLVGTPSVRGSNPPQDDPLLIGRFEVRRAENGFILRFADKPNGKWTEWIAVDTDDLAQQFVKILVENKLDHKP